MSNRKNLRQPLALVLVLSMLVGCGGTQAEPTVMSTPVPTATPLVGLARVDVGGYGLYVRCSGEAGPTVVLDSALGGDYGLWYLVESHIPTRVCVYNRAGIGGSDPAPISPRSNQDMVDDLHALLVNANIPGPYVLVAHSGAGFNARLYADQYPHDVVGMVLVDSSHPDQYARLLALLPPESPDESEAVTKLRQDWGDIDQRDMPESWDFNTSAAQVHATDPLGSLPLVVLTQDVYDLGSRLSEWRTLYGFDFPSELAESLDQEWLQMQKELAALSSNSTHIIVTGSSHMIPLQKPDAVIDAISHVIDAQSK